MTNEHDDAGPSFSERIKKLTDEQRALYEALRQQARASSDESSPSKAPRSQAPVGGGSKNAAPEAEDPPRPPPPPPGGWGQPGFPGAPPGMPGAPPGFPGAPPGMPDWPWSIPGMPTGMPGMPTGMPSWPWPPPGAPGMPGWDPAATSSGPDMPGASSTAPGGSNTPPDSSAGPSARPFGARTPIVALNRNGSRPPLFLVAPVFGSVFPYHHLVKHLDPDQPVYGLQSPALDGHGESHETIPEMATAYVEAIRKVRGCAHGPYYLGGYSFGGWTAYEMARQLLSEGEEVALLAILGTSVPPSMAAPMAAKAAEYYSTLLRDQAQVFTDTGLTDQQRLDHEAAKSWTPLQQVAATNNLAAMRYLPRPIARGLSLFTTVDCLAASPGDKTLGWWMLCTGEVDVHIHDGNHFSILNEPDVRDLATKLSARLALAHEHGC